MESITLTAPPSAPAPGLSPSAAPFAAPPAYSPLLYTGVDVIDRAWGGVFRGGSYLLYGRATSGRDLLTLRFTQVGAELGESCLFISPQRPKDLMIQAASIGFDLRGAYEAGLVKLLRIPSTMAQQGQEDDGILRAIRDLVGLIREYRPQRLVINDFMPFVLFRSFDRLKAAITDLLEHTDVLDMTMVVVMSEPGNDPSRRIVEFVGSQMTGTIHLEMPEEASDSAERRLTLTPHIGHVRGVRSEPFDLDGLLVLHGTAAPAPRALPRLAAPLPERAPEPPAPAEAPAAPPPGPRRAGELPAVPVFPMSRTDAPAPPTPPPMAAPAERTPGEVAGMPGAVVNPYADLDAAHARPLADAAPAPAPMSRPAPVSTPPLPSGSSPFPDAVVDPYAPGGWSPSPVAALPPLDLGVPAPALAEAPPFAQAPPFPQTAPFAQAPPVADPWAATPTPWAAPVGAAPQSVDLVHDRGALHALLAEQYRGFAQRVPFLVVAMRLDLAATPLGFDFMLDMVRAALRPGDRLYGDAFGARLVAVLPQTDAEASGAFFTRLKTQLREAAPLQAEEMLRAIEAVVIPNGDPFPSADALLAYVLDPAS